MRRVEFLFLALLFLGAPVVARAQDCPINSLVAGLPGDHTSTASRDSVGGGLGGCEVEPYFCVHTSSFLVYDLVQGTARAIAQSSSGAKVSTLSTHDIFTLLGPAGGPPVTFTVRVHLSEYIDYLKGRVVTTLREGASNSSTATMSTPAADRTPVDLNIVVTRAAGQTLDLYLVLQATGGGSGGAPGIGDVAAQLAFPDLPPGFGVRSCQGFSTGLAVPTARTSWGSLKLSYR